MNEESSKKRHKPSTIQADTLFTFTSKLEYLLEYIKTGMISPRYCTEDITYLQIPTIKKIAFPMKCFCDINLHRLDIHLEWYGYYGIAFTKKWGMDHGIQPIQYINPKSALRKDFTEAFKSSLEEAASEDDSIKNKIQSFMLHELMYYKPYQGEMKNRNTGIEEIKCFTDECEWRFIPDVTKEGFPPVLHDETIISNAQTINLFNNSAIGQPTISLQFKCEDIKYIIVKNKADFNKLVDILDFKKYNDTEKCNLISKIIIWEDSRGDF